MRTLLFFARPARSVLGRKKVPTGAGPTNFAFFRATGPNRSRTRSARALRSRSWYGAPPGPIQSVKPEILIAVIVGSVSNLRIHGASSLFALSFTLLQS